MSDPSDRPDWLPATPPGAALTPESNGERLKAFLPKLPSLILIAVGFGLLMLGGTCLVLSRSLTGVRTPILTGFSLIVAAAVAFGLAMVIRMAMRARKRELESWANFDMTSISAIPSFPPPRSAYQPMNTRQLFGALLRAVAIWQIINVISEIPQLVGMIEQFASRPNQTVVMYYVLGPTLRAILGTLLFFMADWLASLIYPDDPPRTADKSTNP